MLKKRNIAMTMAVATVATTVAPAFAATLDGQTISVKDSEKIAQLKEEIKGYLDTKLTNPKSEDDIKKPVYEVKVNDNEITTLKELQAYLDELTKVGDSLEIKVTNTVPFAELDGKIIDWKAEQYKASELNDVVTAAKGLDGIVEDVEKVDTNTVLITLKNNETPLTVKTGDVKLVINEDNVLYKEDSYGNRLDGDGNITTEEDDYVVVGFEYNKEKDLDLEDAEEVKTITVEYKSVAAENIVASELYNSTTKRLTKQGDDLAKLLRDYTLKGGSVDLQPGTDSLSITVKIPTSIDEISKSTKKITGTSSQIKAIHDELKNAIDETKLSTLAGETRFSTAVEVSKDAFSDGAETVVLVSGEVIADGLAATPFAKSLGAPILLTGKDAVSTETMDEIERLEASKVYVVGGKSVITEAVIDQLEDKEIEVVRISGADRYETSLKIAEEMELDSTDVFIAGGYAEADTMSIAGVAAREGSPILLADTNGLNDDQKEWLEDKGNKAYVIGGLNSVSKAVMTQLNETVSGSVTRIAGETRQETNAKVINKFYGEEDSIGTIYVAKSNDKGLVDALPAGVAAAIDEAPVVLATDELDASQNSVLNKLNFADESVAKKQVGYGIADKVWVAINKLF